MKQKVLLIDTLHHSFSDLLRDAGFEVVEGYSLSRDEIKIRLNEFAGVAIRSRFKIDADLLSAADELKFIARAGAGMENIDVHAANAKGITCLSAPEGNKDAVAEHAIAMLLALFNHIIRADAEVRNGLWRREENRGIELQGKTIAIIGFGNMGSTFAKRLRGFDVNILAYDKYITINKNAFPWVQQVELNEIYKHAEIVSLHLPLTAETNYFVDDKFLSSFSKPVWLINTARGKNVNTQALVEALKNGRVKGAALDVLEYEALSFEQLDASSFPEPFKYLVASDKVILSPHIAGWTHESNEKIAKVLAEKIINLYKEFT